MSRVKKQKNKIIVRDKIKSKNLNPKAEIIPQYYAVFGVQPYHNAGNFGSGTSVYVIDSGLNGTVNPDLKNVIVEQFGSPGSPIDHGGLTTALIAAPMNGYGVVGIAPDATVYLGDIDDRNGDIMTSAIVSALDSAMAKNVDIVNISLGGPEQDPILSNAILRAYNQGILIFVSAGNEGTSWCEYPACDTGAISVGSTNIDHVVSDFSNVNDKTVLYAPGEDFPLPNQSGGISYVSGTSFSSPFAAGLAALVLSTRRIATGNPALKISREEMISILQNPQHLNAAALTFPPKSSTSFWWIILIVIGVIIAIVVIVAIISAASRNRSPTPYPTPPRVINDSNL